MGDGCVCVCEGGERHGYIRWTLIRTFKSFSNRSY